jgi:hypothetical protein
MFSCQLNGRRSIRERHLPGDLARRRVPSAPPMRHGGDDDGADDDENEFHPPIVAE